MNRIKISLGVLVLMLTAIVSAFFVDISSVRADNLRLGEYGETLSIENDEAGSYEGTGFYLVGETAILKATMNPGYRFIGWIEVDSEGNELGDTELSTELEYSFVVERDIYIGVKWERIEYSVSLAEGLDVDFNMSITNNNGNASLYYGDRINIVISNNNTHYIYNISKSNIYINDKSVSDLGYITNTNHDTKGFQQFDITLDVYENMEIEIEYDYMYMLTLQSQNEDASITELLEHKLITVQDYYSTPAVGQYLIWENQTVTINTYGGDRVYKFEYSQFNSQPISILVSQTFELTEDSIFKVAYNKVSYKVEFEYYLKNGFENYDLMDNILYQITAENLTAGQNLEISYKDSQILVGDKAYDKAGIYGYRFVGISLGDVQQYENEVTFTMDTTNPKDSTIKILFELIQYNLSIQLVDTFFESGVEYTLSTNNPTIQTLVTASATSNSYEIAGWKQTADAETYLSNDSSYSFNFSPVSDDDSVEYAIYLDIDYKYISASYTLSSDSITKNMDYDTVSISGDEYGGKINFTSSENDVPAIIVQYVASNVSISGTTVTISTGQMFGDLIIENAWSDGSKIIYGDLTEYSISTVKEDDAYVYAFQKYTYFADLEIAKIDKIGITENDGSAEVELAGVVYNGKTATEYSQTITGTMAYDNQVGAYKINYTYPIYVFKDDDGNYTKAVLMDVEYDWNGTEFVQPTATKKPLKLVETTLTKSSEYELVLDNLLVNNVLIFISNTTSSISYGFLGNNRDGAILSYVFLNDGKIGSILRSEAGLAVTAEYIKLKGDISIRITNGNAYNGKDVEISIDGQVEHGLTIVAVSGASVEVSVDLDKINKGYTINGFMLNGVYASTSSSFSFIMSEAYLNKTIYIVFSEIEYTININYLDSDGNKITNVDNLHVKLTFGTEELLMTQIVSVGNSYRFKAILNGGYYISNAYIGTEAYILTSLIQTNADYGLEMAWVLNQDNFESAIIDNANTENQVQLYIRVMLHNYSLSVYFEIGANINELTKPSIIMNGVYKSFSSTIEDLNGVSTLRYKAILQQIDHGEEVEIQLYNIASGIYISSWKNANGQTTGYTGLKINVGEITKDIVLIAEFDYIYYDISFVYLDENEYEVDSGLYGTATSSQSSYIKFQDVKYSVVINKGYVLAEQYYLDKAERPVEVNGTFKFDPVQVNIEDGAFKVYLKFDLKKVDLTITTSESAGMVNKYSDPLITLEISRVRGKQHTILTDETGYQFVMGDTLIMKATTISVGIILKKVQFGDISIALDSATINYSLEEKRTTTEDGENEIYYELTIIFDANMISELEDNVELNNVLDNRKYNVVYTYNFIEKKFGIRLAVTNLDDNKTSLLGEDKEFAEEIGFGTYMNFKCAPDTLENVISKKFKVLGFIVAGEEVRTDQVLYELNSLEAWEKLALSRYNKGSNKIEIVLKLSPKITLQNCEDNVYTTYYNGLEQGLKVGTDVLVEGDFAIIIKYSTDMLIYTENLPINANTYDVKISATIAISANEIIEVVLDEEVTYIINKRPISIKTTYNTENPLVKEYDGTNNVNTRDLFNGLKLNGLMEADENSIKINSSEIRGNYSSSQANTSSRLYDVTVYNIYLIDTNNNLPQNYELQLGDAGIVFEKIGKITPKKLYISGFSAKDKVYDGTDYIAVDTQYIQYSGKLEIDSTKIITDNLKFYLGEYSVGYQREILLDYSNALTGADSTNYTVSYNKTYIDIYPYEKQCKIEGFGTFKIVDKDKLCIIPMEADFFGTAYLNGNIEYRNVYPLVETYMTRAEKFNVYYEFKMKVGVVTSALPSGVYLYIPNSAKLSKVLQVDGDNLEKLSFEKTDDFDIVKIGEGKSKIAIIAKTTYVPLWVIILIVTISLGFILLCVLTFVIIRKKKTQKYSVNDKI